jgi:lipooligosaccharide transport system permease protein
MRNKVSVPSFIARISGVWNRHFRVYTRNIISNGFPPFLDPLVFLAGVGLGLGIFVKEMDGVPYIQFLATGLLISTAMMTSAFECSFGTFIRLEFDKVYDGMIAAPMSAEDLLLGEILWAGTKGFFFSLAVLFVVACFGILRSPQSLLVPLIGFLTGIMFSALSLLVTSFVKTIDHFNFYFTGFLSPLFFFCGVVFPVSTLPKPLQFLAEIMPLTHPLRLSRAICFDRFNISLLWDISYIFIFIMVVGFFAIRRLKKKLID